MLEAIGSDSMEVTDNLRCSVGETSSVIQGIAFGVVRHDLARLCWIVSHRIKAMIAAGSEWTGESRSRGVDIGTISRRKGSIGSNLETWWD